MNPQGINRLCQKIAKDEMLFEKYRTALKRDKYEIDIDGFLYFTDVKDPYWSAQVHQGRSISYSS